MGQSNAFRIHRSMIGILTALFLEAGLSLPAFALEVHRFEISATDAAAAIHEFGNQSGIQILVSADALRGKRLNRVAGDLSTDDGLKKLLADTGLSHRYVGEHAVALIAESAAPGTERPDESELKDLWGRIRLARIDQAPREHDTSHPEEPSAARNSDQPSDRKDVQRVQLGEVLVTATKREARVQDVPLSIAVISNEDIERRGLIGMEDYLRQIPGVNQIDEGPFTNAIVIRGITTSPEFENFSSGTTVASYFDETPITGAAGVAAGGIDLRPVDIARIEVLRGPQGTTFGSASLGGTMRMIPVKPQLEGFSARVASYFSSTEGNGSENWMGQAVVNIPVVKDRFAVRGVAYHYDESGFYRNVAGIDPDTLALAESFGLGDFVRGHVQDDVGRLVTDGGRVSALWQPTGKLDVSLNLLTQKIDGDGVPAETSGEFQQAAFPVPPVRRIRGEAGEVGDTEMDLANLVLKYDFGWAELTTIGSWIDGGQAWAFTRNAVFGLPSDVAVSDFNSLTGETRLASQFKGPFQFLGGLFYEDIRDELLEIGDWPGSPETNPFSTNPQSVAQLRRDLEQYAVFGEVSYDLTETLTGTVGGRYFEFDRTERSLFEGGLFGVPLGEGVAELLTSEEDGSSFKANISYEPKQDWLLYAAWTEGFRLGRPSSGLPDFCDTDGDSLVDGTDITIQSTRSIDSDFLENYEIGAKFAFFDRRMIVDAAVYHIEWDGLPIFTIAGGTGPCAEFGYTANVGSATSDGVELQARLIVTEGLELDFGVGYVNAELSEDAPGLGAEDGARLPGSPEVNANLSAQYDFEIAGYKAFVRADSFYTGKFHSDLLESPGTRAGDYVKVDARTGVILGNFNIEVFVRNLTNKDAFTWRAPFFTLGSYRLRPRTVGIQLGYTFE